MPKKPQEKSEQEKRQEERRAPRSARFHTYGQRKPHVSFTRDLQQKFIELYRDSYQFGGRRALCCEQIGISLATFKKHIKDDPEFKEAFDEAHEAWFQAHIYAPALVRATDGILEPIIGGEFRDQVVGHKRIVSDGLMSMLLKRYDPGFRDKDVGDTAQGHAGVLIVPSSPGTVTSWEGQLGSLARGKETK